MIRPSTGSRFVPALVLVLALGVLAGAVEQGSQHLRRVLREQMVNRDGEILYAVAQAQQFNAASTNLAGRLAKRTEQLALVLQISQLKEGVLAVRLFDANGKFVTAFPPNVTEVTLNPATLVELKKLRPLSRYSDSGRLADLFLTDPSDTSLATNLVPLLEADIPIHASGDTNLLACAQIVVDAHDVQLSSASLDHHLRLQALGAFAAGGTLLTVALLWAYHRLQKSNQLLEERTARLLRANHELTLAAKTGALGAVTAHLIHGLSNPLANLQDFVAAGSAGVADCQWTDALAATRRMQQLVHEVVRVLSEGSDGDGYEITLAEFATILESKVQPMAQKLGVTFAIDLAAEGRLSNHQANIILLIMENLVHNALQVTPRGKPVRVSIRAAEPGVVCEVADHGPGFPEALVKHLFEPCRSTKGGAGLGLAISKQLANQIGGQLELKDTSPAGSVIALTLPHSVFTPAHASAPRSQ